MTERVRTRHEVGSGFKIPNNGDDPQVLNYNSFEETTVDFVAKGDNHNFTTEKLRRNGGLINGKSPGSITGAQYKDYPCTFQRINYNFMDHLSIQTEDDTYYATKALTRTMPERSSLEALVSCLEVREVPGLLEEAYSAASKKLREYIGRRAFARLRKAAKINLMVQFGILPILSDLSTLIEFNSLVEARVNELKRLRDSNGLRRTVTLDRLSDSSLSDVTTVHSSAGIHKCRFRRSTSEIVKGHVRWYTNVPEIWDDAQLRRRARIAVAGAYLDPYMLYEAMPWSWLIDYFTNLGDYIATTRNELEPTPSDPRITRIVRTQTSSESHTSPEWAYLSTFHNEKETITRRMTPIGLSARSSFLTVRQTSILGSLAILRG